MQKVSPTGLLIVCAAGDAGPDMTTLRARHLQHRVREAADSDNVLLEQPDDEDKLSTLAEDVQKGSEKGRRLTRTRL